MKIKRGQKLRGHARRRVVRAARAANIDLQQWRIRHSPLIRAALRAVLP